MEYRQFVIDYIRKKDNFPKKLTSFGDRWVNFMLEKIEEEKTKLLDKDEYILRFPKFSFELWIKRFHNYNVERFGGIQIEKLEGYSQSMYCAPQEDIIDPISVKKLIEKDIPMWYWEERYNDCNHPILQNPDFYLLPEDCVEFDVLDEKYKNLIRVWNDEEKGFQTILHGGWKGNDNPRDPPPITIEELEIIAPFVDKNKGYSWWNQEVPISNNVTNSASKNQLTVLMKHDSRGQLNVSYDNNRFLGDALCGSSEDNDQFGRISVLISHPSFVFNRVQTIGNGYQSPFEQTPVYRFLNMKKYDDTHQGFFRRPIIPSSEEMQKRINYLFEKFIPLLKKEDQYIAIAEAFFWARKSSSDCIELLIENTRKYK